MSSYFTRGTVLGDGLGPLTASNVAYFNSSAPFIGSLSSWLIVGVVVVVAELSSLLVHEECPLSLYCHERLC